MLQQLFTSPILSVQSLHSGYEDHASDIFLVRTEDSEVIIRSSKMNEKPNNDFWWGCKNLFGIMLIPRLEECRQPYRYLYRLLSVQGSVELEKWLRHPSY